MNGAGRRPDRLRAVVRLLLAAPALWLAWQWHAGLLGADALEEAIHRSGLWTARLLLLTLAVTPARALLRWPAVMPLRRTIGLATFAYAALHLALYATDLGWAPGAIATELARRVYLTIGIATFAILAALAATSPARIARALGGRRWQRAHRLVYLAGALAMAHAAMQAKIDVSEAMLMAGLFAWLMGWRLLKRAGHTGTAALAALSLVTALLTALVEAAWYALATGVDPALVLAANLDPAFGLRPAAWAGLAGLALTAIAWLRHRAPPPRRQARPAPPVALAADGRGLG